jgi:hypothetical protein
MVSAKKRMVSGRMNPQQVLPPKMARKKEHEQGQRREEK